MENSVTSLVRFTPGPVSSPAPPPRARTDVRRSQLAFCTLFVPKLRNQAWARQPPGFPAHAAEARMPVHRSGRPGTAVLACGNGNDPVGDLERSRVRRAFPAGPSLPTAWKGRPRKASSQDADFVAPGGYNACPCVLSGSLDSMSGLAPYTQYVFRI